MMKARPSAKVLVEADYDEANRLLTAGIINERFGKLLVENPKSALETGYNGTAFCFSPGIHQEISAIQARDISTFAFQLRQIFNLYSIEQKDRHNHQLPTMRHLFFSSEE